MDSIIRAAVVSRYGAIVGKDAIVPTSWEQIGNFTLQLMIQSQDPELAMVLKGSMPAELEQQVLAGKWSADAPVQKTSQQLAQEREQAVTAAFAGLEAQSAAMRERNERLQVTSPGAARASRELANAALKAQAQARGVL